MPLLASCAEGRWGSRVIDDTHLKEESRSVEEKFSTGTEVRMLLRGGVLVVTVVGSTGR